VSDNIVILNKGRVEQVGTPEEVYDHPANPFVYGFLGNVNLFHARIDKGVLQLENNGAAPKDTEISFFVRPHDVSVSLSNENGKGIKAKITAHRILGSRVRVELQTLEGGKEIEADIDKKQWTVIREQNQDTVYIIFFSAKIYSKDEVWSDYSI
jgi:sulfate transport system ATP-binding protein